MIQTDNFDKVHISSAEELRSWLVSNHQSTESVWLVTYKKSTPDKYVSVQAVLDELLCFGWIDGIRRKLDTEQTMQLISPRKTQHWTKTYKDRAVKLEAAGKMTPAGKASIERSKTMGLWTFMDDVDALIQPEDLKIAFAKHPNSLDNFNRFAPSSQRFVLRWIKLAKTEKTSSKRVAQIAELAAKNEKLPGS